MEINEIVQAALESGATVDIVVICKSEGETSVEEVEEEELPMLEGLEDDPFYNAEILFGGGGGGGGGEQDAILMSNPNQS